MASEADPDRTGTLIVAVSTAPALADVERSVLVLFGVAAGRLLLTAGIAYLVAGRILKPLRDMREVAADITAADLSAHVPIQGDDEIAAFGRTLNGMLDRVQGAQDAQQAFAVRARRHLAEPRERIREAVAVLGDESVHPAARRRAAESAGRELDSMQRIADALGSLAEQHYPAFARPRRVLLSDLAARIRSEAVRAHPGRVWDLDERSDREAWLDPDRVAEAVRHLVDNAGDHSAPGAPIRLGVGEHGEAGRSMVSVWVANKGRSLEPEGAERVFADPQSDAPQGRGMGFGLAVVRAVADAHQGSAWVESGPGRDTRFGLDLPADVDGPGGAVAEEFQDGVVASLREES